MSLRVVDKLVREGKYRQAMRALDRARELYPDNPYIPAYEERLRGLLNRQRPQTTAPADTVPLQEGIATMSNAPLCADLPSVEGQLNSIAVPRAKAEPEIPPVNQELRRQEERRLALEAKITTHLEKATGYLERGELDQALQEIWRASLLDPANPGVLALEARAKAAKEETLQLEKAQRDRAEKEQEAEREKRRKEELARLQREEEERLRMEEEARRNAEQMKIRMCLSQARGMLDAERFKEAEAELSFALVINPDHGETLALLEEIRARAEAARVAEIQRRREEEERQRIERERIRAEVDAAIASARQASARRDFQEAFRIVTRAYVLDPASVDLQSCEREIELAREEWNRQQEEEKRRLELELSERRERERRQIDEEERLRVIKERLAQVEARRQAAEREMNLHLQRAKELLAVQEFERALAEVALAFKANPLAQEVKDVEQLVIRTQSEASRTPDPAAEESTEQESTDPEILTRIASHLAAASGFAARGEYTKAFDEIAHAYALDPLDDTIEECERNIQGQFTQFLDKQNPAAAPRKDDALPAAEPLSSPAGPAPEPLPGDAEHTAAPLESVSGVNALSLFLGFIRRKRKLAISVAATSCSAIALVVVTTTRSSTDNQSQAPAAAKSVSQEQAPVVPSRPETQPSGATDTQKQIAPPLASRDAAGSISAKPGPGTDRKEKKQESTPPAGAEKNDAPNGTTLQPPQSSEPAASQPEVLPDRMDQNIAALKTNPLDVAPAEPPRVPKPAEVVRLQKPVFSAAALKIGAQGEVVVRVEIGQDGKPLSASVVRSSSQVLNDAVVEAVMSSEYKAGVPENGESSTWVTIPFKFVK